jgi:hypothetical protein
MNGDHRTTSVAPDAGVAITPNTTSAAQHAAILDNVPCVVPHRLGECHRRGVVQLFVRPVVTISRRRVRQQLDSTGSYRVPFTLTDRRGVSTSVSHIAKIPPGE